MPTAFKDNKYIFFLAYKWKYGTITPHEMEQLNQWYDSKMVSEFSISDENELQNKLLNKIKAETLKNKSTTDLPNSKTLES